MIEFEEQQNYWEYEGEYKREGLRGTATHVEKRRGVCGKKCDEYGGRRKEENR